MKVSCFTCKNFLKTFSHNSENNRLKDNLLLCKKIGFRIFDNKNPNIYCNFYSPIQPRPKPIINKLYIKNSLN
jgi:hypothetical protein